MKTIDYYLSPGSPGAYLGHQRLADMAKRHGATINVKTSPDRLEFLERALAK